ncbi:AAA family ATPase [Hydrogenophaga defluvii]|uniref:AAA family ATPase n=1 Tax=Hydrogenophaga defluvii TaxID=249410 RepID=A0ABW2SCR8_9BURK
MSLTVSTELIAATVNPSFEKARDYAKVLRDDREIRIDASQLDTQALGDLIAAATAVGDAKAVRAVESIAQARAGDFGKPVPNFKAFQGVVEAFLKSSLIDGWIYVEGRDGKMYPELVTSISFDDGKSHGRGQPTPTVRIRTTSYGFNRDGNIKGGISVYGSVHTFSPQDVARRRVADILADQGLYKETQALRDAHMESLDRHRKVTQGAFAQQFRVSGVVYQYEEDHYHRRNVELTGRRVIHDLESKDYGTAQRYVESSLFDAAPDTDDGAMGVGPIPEHPLVKVFDLSAHEFFWVNADNLTPYQYDKTLREKLILPPTHRDLLDVLTTDLNAFVNDFIEGKSAGNVILCKGIPGVGKTLTAEVYAELIDKPLYSIHSGALGTTAQDIEKNLRTIFQRGKRWDCVLLLDEADVFVVQRGNNIEQNAIVAEFLRTLEYFDGLLFMTTNRSDQIDEAIISRCAAIINYDPPGPKDAAAIWRVMATQYQAPLSDELIAELVELFPEIAPRDTKMLLRLALRVAVAHKEPLTLATFRRCAMFRAIKMQETAA